MRFLSVADTSAEPSDRSMSGAETTAPPGMGTRPTRAGITATRNRRLGMSADAKSQRTARCPPCVRIELRTKTPAQTPVNMRVSELDAASAQSRAESPRRLPARRGSSRQAARNAVQSATRLGTRRIRASVARTASGGGIRSEYHRRRSGLTPARGLARFGRRLEEPLVGLLEQPRHVRILRRGLLQERELVAGSEEVARREVHRSEDEAGRAVVRVLDHVPLECPKDAVERILRREERGQVRRGQDARVAI